VLYVASTLSPSTTSNWGASTRTRTWSRSRNLYKYQ